MKWKNSFSSFLILFFLIAAGIGAADFFDDFESYEVDSDLPDDHLVWNTWDGADVDGIISEEFSSSGNNSLMIESGDDVVAQFYYTEGIVEVSAMVYIPEEHVNSAYFILMNQYTHGGDPKSWALQAELNAAAMTVTAEGSTTSLIVDEWVEIKAVLDLDNNVQYVFYDGKELLFNHIYAPNNIAEFGAVDLWAPDGSSPAYFDDVRVSERPLMEASQVKFSGPSMAGTGTPLKLTLGLRDEGEIPTTSASDVTITLESDSATGAFDVTPDGVFDGTVTSVTITAGQSTADIYYKDDSDGEHIITVSAAGLTGGTQKVTFFEQFTEPGEVVIYTGVTWWITKDLADEQAQITVDRLDTIDIPNEWFDSTIDDLTLSEWVADSTDNGKLDVLVLYGDFPATLYASGNTETDGSIAELFIESTDGDAIINHADWMFYGQGRNGPAGLQNMMDIPGIRMDVGSNDMVVTAEGAEIAPSLTDFTTGRSFNISGLANDWFVEVALAQSVDGTQGDPVIVRDGTFGRLIPVYQTNGQNNPKGAVAAEIIAWLMRATLPEASQTGINGPESILEGLPVQLTINLQDETGIPVKALVDTTVTLASDSATGAFDTDMNGSYDGTLTSVTIPSGELSVTVYFKETTTKSVTLSATTENLTPGELQVTIIEDFADKPGEVAIYTGNVNWIDKPSADIQAQICVDALDEMGIANTWYADPLNQADLAEWLTGATENGEQDVLIIYGYFPESIYPAGNALPDGSVAELFIESTDGDTIINHADWMFYVSSTNNGSAGLHNMMDIPGVNMAGNDNTPMVPTSLGEEIAPSLTAFNTDRPFHIETLSDNWFVEAALAQNANGNLVDPCIVRDGNRGRIINVYQTNAQPDDPKGAVAAEIIDWLMEKASGGTSDPEFKRGDANEDSTLNLADAIFVLSYLFANGDDPVCMDTADTNDDGAVNLADAISILSYLFASGDDLADPFKVCGIDPTADDLDCGSYTACAK